MPADLPVWTRRDWSLLLAGLGPAAAHAAGPRPNILWITCEDTGPHLGCYGDRYANTPHLDAFARRSLRYEHAWSNAPVCAPARTAIISGMYPTATGSEHMRSIATLPPEARMFPCYLRDGGYFCTNNSKEDYNLEHTGVVWDDSSRKAHWRRRQPGQPFFAVFNFESTHESQIRRRPHTLVHDPARVRIPAYHPDAPEVRHDWAQYYDNIATMDGQAGRVLRELEDDGLADGTVVFFFGDHGSGMPRSKRSPCNSGLRVPLIVHVPERFAALAPRDYRPDGSTDRLVSFVDLAPTVLSLAGVRPPAHLHGRAFCGAHPETPPRVLHGFRGRMDERYDLVRSVTDGRYVYLRNYMPHRIAGQHVAYMFETPTTRVWKRWFDEGKLNAEQSRFWQRKAPEELYDLERDPDEVASLAGSPDHARTLSRLRDAQQEHARTVRDIGFLPEPEIHERAGTRAPFDAARDAKRLPLQRIFSAAHAASAPRGAVPRLDRTLRDPDSAVRYWAAMAALIRGSSAVAAHREALTRALADTAPPVRIAAAEALATYGGEAGLRDALPVLVSLSDPAVHGVLTALLALNSVDALESRAQPVVAQLRGIRVREDGVHQRFRGWVPRVLEHILSRFRTPVAG